MDRVGFIGAGDCQVGVFGAIVEPEDRKVSSVSTRKVAVAYDKVSSGWASAILTL